MFEAGMPAVGAVAAFYELDARHAGLALGFEAAAVEQFAFERGEETLAHCVIEAIADGAHRGPHARLAATLAEGERMLLSRFERSSQHKVLCHRQILASGCLGGLPS